MVTSEGSISFIDEKCELSCIFLAFVTVHFQEVSVGVLMLMLQQNKHSCATFRPCLHCRVLSRKGSLCQQNREGVDTAVPLLATKCQCRCCCSLDCQYWPPPVSYQCPLWLICSLFGTLLPCMHVPLPFQSSRKFWNFWQLSSSSKEQIINVECCCLLY